MGTISKNLRMNSLKVFGLSCLAAPFLVGCSIDASLTDLAEDIVAPIFQKGSAKEIVPTSQQGTVTTDGYLVQSSVDFHNGPPEYVTSGGYRVSTSVQGSIFKK
ncbi:hypothetical protein D3C87_299630 [compost metagenome]